MCCPGPNFVAYQCHTATPPKQRCAVRTWLSVHRLEEHTRVQRMVDENARLLMLPHCDVLPVLRVEQVLQRLQKGKAQQQ